MTAHLELSEEQAEAMAQARWESRQRQMGTAVPWKQVGGGFQRQDREAIRAAYAASPARAMAAKLSALEEGLEGLRELSERAAAGPWELSPEEADAPISIYGPDDMDADDRGRSVYIPPDLICTMADCSLDEANAAFIVAAVNLVRTILTKEQTRG